MCPLTLLGSLTPMLTTQSLYDLVFCLIARQSCRPRTKAHSQPHILPSLLTTAGAPEFPIHSRLPSCSSSWNLFLQGLNILLTRELCQDPDLAA